MTMTPTKILTETGLHAELRGAPFHLDAEALDWVEVTLAGLGMRSRLAQLLMPLVMDPRPEALQRVINLGVGGVSRFASSPPEQLRGTYDLLRTAPVPVICATDLELGELTRIGGPAGTGYPNQMGVAATDDAGFAAKMGTIAAREGRALGFHWTWTPIIDLDLNPGNAGVNTRSFGSDPERVIRMGVAAAGALQASGVAATMKHWPGDGVDSRNMHLVTSENTLSMAEWRAGYGQIYADMIAAGTKTVMSAHITLPAYAHEQGRPQDADLPGSISPLLNETLLRGELGFQGLIITDASLMAGLSSQGRRSDIVWRTVAAGCDMILFSDDLEADLTFLQDAVDAGHLSGVRVKQAARRVLALKASLGLHHREALPALARLGCEEHQIWARDCAAQSVTLVRDRQNLLPMTPQTHPRLLIIRQPKRVNGFGAPLPDLEVPALLRGEGFDVTIYTPDTEVDSQHYDALLYLLADEGLLVRQHLNIDWPALHGGPLRAMQRHWETLPTALISFGTPYYAPEVPRCQTLINAYVAVPAVQQAVVDTLTGKQPFLGVSPVDAGRGLRD